MPRDRVGGGEAAEGDSPKRATASELTAGFSSAGETVRQRQEAREWLPDGCYTGSVVSNGSVLEYAPKEKKPGNDRAFFR